MEAVAAPKAEEERPAEATTEEEKPAAATADLRTVRIRLRGDGIGKQREFRMVQELTAAASKILIEKGFHFVESGIEVDAEKGGIALSFPCEISARGFWLLFRDYVWESDAYHCLFVELRNIEFERQYSTLEPEVRHRFFKSSEVTPVNVLAYFC